MADGSSITSNLTFDITSIQAKQPTSCQASHTAISEVIGAGETMADNGGPKPQKKAESLPPSTSAKNTRARPPRLPRKLHPEVISAQIKDILSALLVFRFINALCVRTFFQPDEYFQALEPAWSMAFGSDSGAWLTWVNKYFLPPLSAVRGCADSGKQGMATPTQVIAAPSHLWCCLQGRLLLDGLP